VLDTRFSILRGDIFQRSRHKNDEKHTTPSVSILLSKENHGIENMKLMVIDFIPCVLSKSRL